MDVISHMMYVKLYPTVRLYPQGIKEVEFFYVESNPEAFTTGSHEILKHRKKMVTTPLVLSLLL